MEDKYYTPKEIAEMLKINYLTVYRWIRAGDLPVYQLQRQYRIKESDLKEFMESHKKA